MIEAENGYVKTETHQSITTIEFSHPKSNSLPSKILEQLASEIHFAGQHAETKVIVIKSSGDGIFCAGASFDELITIKTEAEGLKFFSGYANVINAIRKCPKFVIGRVHGKCVGGGVGIAAAVDYCIATEKCDVKLSELSIGIGPFVVGPVIERRIGTSAYSHLAIDATMWRSSDWAKKKGLFAEVHPTTENMDESIQRLSNNLAHNSPDAMREMKKVFWKGTENWDELLKERAGISGKLILSTYARTALDAASQKKQNYL